MHPGTSSMVRLRLTEETCHLVDHGSPVWAQTATTPRAGRLDNSKESSPLHSWVSLAPTLPIQTDFLLTALLEVPAGLLNFWDLLWTAWSPSDEHHLAPSECKSLCGKASINGMVIFCLSRPYNRIHILKIEMNTHLARKYFAHTGGKGHN